MSSTALQLVTVSFVRSLYFDAIARLRIRLAWLDETPLLMTTACPDDDGPEYSTSRHKVDLDFLVGTINDCYQISDDPECGCTEFTSWRGECPHGNYPALSGDSPSDVARAVDEINRITDRKSIRSWMSEGYDPQGYVHVVAVETEGERAKRQREERRVELEQAAGCFAKTHNVKAGTFDFIRALKRELRSARYTYENYNSYESRAEEYMDHRYAGATEYYYENRDFTNSRHHDRIDTLRGIMEWLDESCPLLMAQYRERQLKRKLRKKQ